MLQIETIHEQAMDIAEDAFAAKRKGRNEEAVRLFSDALQLERQAAFSFAAVKESEPSRSILFRSAAALAFHAGDYEQAEYLVANGMAGFPPLEIKNELRQLQDEINFRHHISLQGTELTERQMQMILWGNATGHGIIAADLLVKRIEQIKVVFYRTVERLSNIPYRVMGKPSKFVTDHYQLFLNALVPGSFGVTFTISQPIEYEQLELSLPELHLNRVQPAQVIDEVITCFELVQQDEADALQRRFPDNDYYQNFIAMAKQMAPDGESIKSLSLVAARDGSKTAVLRKTKQEIQLYRVDYAIGEIEEKKVTKIEGHLKVADSLNAKNETGKVKVVQKDGHTVTIRVPVSQMQDVVQPYFDEYVVITGYRQRGAFYLTDIEGKALSAITEAGEQGASTPTLFDEM